MIPVENGIGMKKKTAQNLFENFLPYQISYTSNYNNSFRREFQVSHISSDIGSDEFAILMLIDLAPNISQTDIAKYLFKGKAHVGKMLNDMESKGYLKRVVDTRDNVMIKKSIMTEKAKKYLEYGKQKSLIIEDRMQKEFTEEEVKEFISYLKRFRGVLSSLVDVKLK